MEGETNPFLGAQPIREAALAAVPRAGSRCSRSPCPVLVSAGPGRGGSDETSVHVGDTRENRALLRAERAGCRPPKPQRCCKPRSELLPGPGCVGFQSLRKGQPFLSPPWLCWHHAQGGLEVRSPAGTPGITRGPGSPGALGTWESCRDCPQPSVLVFVSSRARREAFCRDMEILVDEPHLSPACRPPVPHCFPQKGAACCLGCVHGGPQLPCALPWPSGPAFSSQPGSLGCCGVCTAMLQHVAGRSDISGCL